VVVCTTTDPSDDALVEAVEAYGCSVFRGSVDDIIDRFSAAMKAFGFDAVIQADGDDPLSSTEYMDETMATLLEDSRLDIVTVSGLPLGCATKSFTKAAMDKVIAAYKTRKNDTGFIYFFTKSGLCTHLDLQCERSDFQHDTARLTLDYKVDLDVFEAIFKALYREGEIATTDEVVKFLKMNHDVVEHNRHVEKDYWQRTAEKSKLTFFLPDGAEKHISF
jgi:spore coat polysaccharide biosynthesis protein SpsF